MRSKLIFLGGGGHAISLFELISPELYEIKGICAPNIANFFQKLRIQSISNTNLMLLKDSCMLINGLGFLPKNNSRKKLYIEYLSLGFKFESIISTTAIVSSHSNIGDGAQIMHNAVVNANASIGANTIINTGAVIEHDVKIGDNCHIAPGAIICGESIIGDDTFIGAGAIIIQGQAIDSGSIIPANTLIKNK